jgi:transposase
MKRQRRKFTKEFKAEVVRLVLDGGHSVPAVCRDQDLGETSVYLWVNQARVDRGQGAGGALTAYFAKGQR